jgi:hypothetical protein
LPETAQRYFDEGKQWVKDNPLDSAALALSPVPVAGDIAGAAADVYHYYQNPDDLTWDNLGLSALGLVPWVPHMSSTLKLVKGTADAGADALHVASREMVMTKSAAEVRKELDLLRLGGQAPVKIGELSADQMREILKVVPSEAGEAFLVTDGVLEATPKLVTHLRQNHYDDMERLLHRLPDFPSKGQVVPNKSPGNEHRPMLLLRSEQDKTKYDIFVIDATINPGKITPITVFEGDKRYGDKARRGAM